MLKLLPWVHTTGHEFSSAWTVLAVCHNKRCWQIHWPACSRHSFSKQVKGTKLWASALPPSHPLLAHPSPLLAIFCSPWQAILLIHCSLACLIYPHLPCRYRAINCLLHQKRHLPPNFVTVVNSGGGTLCIWRGGNACQNLRHGKRFFYIFIFLHMKPYKRPSQIWCFSRIP